MVNQSALAQELDGIIEMVSAFSPEFHALIELRGKIAPQPKPEWCTAFELERDVMELQYQGSLSLVEGYQQAAM